MARLGARHTVNGYLDEIARRDLLWDPTEGECPDRVNANWNALTGALPRKWQSSAFISELIDRSAGVAWGYTSTTRRNPLGKEDQTRFCRASIVDLVHRDWANAGVCWSEPSLSVQAWRVSARAGKARIEILPSNLVVSGHALRRLYERTGGAHYNEFPALVASTVDAILRDLHPMLAAGAFLKTGSHIGTLALPVAGGLAIIELNQVFASRRLPQLGTTLSIKGRFVSQKRAPNLTHDLSPDDEFDDTVHTVFCTMRTFYGFEELNDERRQSLLYLELIAERLAGSPMSFARLLEFAGDHKAPNGRETDLGPSPCLIADALDSLEWLQPERDDHLLVYPGGLGMIAAQAISQAVSASSL